jgi:hypothetical protein
MRAPNVYCLPCTQDAHQELVASAPAEAGDDRDIILRIPLGRPVSERANCYVSSVVGLAVFMHTQRRCSPKPRRLCF